MKTLSEFIKNNKNLIDLMKKCSYHYDNENLNLHHLEGDVWTHTLMAYINTVKYKCSTYVKWAVLLHDIGRIYTRTENISKKRVSFGDFEGASIFTSIDILNKTKLTHDEKIKVLKIISYQYTIIDHVKYKKPSHETLLNKFKYEEDILHELSNYVKCDLLGRKIDKSRIHFYNKESIEHFIGYTKNIQKNIKETKEKKNTLNILVGPPCSKKSTWVKKYNNEAIIINRDSSVEEIGKKYNKNSYDEAYNYMLKNPNIKIEVDALEKKIKYQAINSKNIDVIIDNPNLSSKNRKTWINIFKNTHTISVVVFLSSFNELQKCSEERKKKINKSISKKGLINKFKLFNYPLLNEGIDNISYK